MKHAQFRHTVLAFYRVDEILVLIFSARLLTFCASIDNLSRLNLSLRSFGLLFLEAIGIPPDIITFVHCDA